MAKSMKNAILKSLDDFERPATSNELYENAIEKKYIDLADYGGKTPDATWQSRCGDFIRNNDTRVKRIKGDGREYLYYLTSKEMQMVLSSEKRISKKEKNNDISFNERALHKLFVSYLKSQRIYAKTIFHEKSTLDASGYHRHKISKLGESGE